MKITYIGHGTVSIENAGQCLLTDPFLSKKALYFRRHAEPGLTSKDIPSPTAILISHSHYDHLDLFSFKFFKTTIPIIVPKGLGKFVQKFLPNPIVEIAPWSHHSQSGIEIHAVPVRHRGWRWLPFRHNSASAYVIKSAEGHVYFAGDTGPGNHFAETAAVFSIDLALLPIGGYHPQWLHKHSKLTPAGALAAFSQLQAKFMIPINWGTFGTLNEKPNEAIQLLQKQIVEKHIEARVKILSPGQSWSLPQVVHPASSLRSQADMRKVSER